MVSVTSQEPQLSTDTESEWKSSVTETCVDAGVLSPQFLFVEQAAKEQVALIF